MAAFDEQKAAVQAAIDQVKSDAAAKIGAVETEAAAKVADAEKKLQDAADSAVSLDELKAWCDEIVTGIKGILG